MNLLQSKKFSNYIQSKTAGISWKSVQSVYKLHEEGATVPFMARYRKEQTDNLDEVQIRKVLQCFENFQVLEKRRAFILEELENQKVLSCELKKQISETDELRDLEEFYRPYKKKKKTKATLAREAGLQDLADWIWKIAQGELKDSMALEVKAKGYINVKKSFVTYADAVRGAQHIIKENIYNNSELRQLVKDHYAKDAKIKSQKTKDFKDHSKFENYAKYEEPCKNLLDKRYSYRYLALRRGSEKGELKVTIEGDNEKLLKEFQAYALKVKGTAVDQVVLEAAKDALEIHALPSISNEQHALMKETADSHSIDVFADNVKRILMSSPFGSRVVLGIDPGLRTGCKVSLIDGGGQFISHTVINILGKEPREKAKKLLSEVFKQVKIEAIAIGNGTGGRETEKFIRETLKSLGKEDILVTMVNESGASVYSASDIARNEFPDLDITIRGAISIARRFQDPLAELVKIDPKSIGVGQYQHDVSQALLKKSLSEVVESCVNKVGVDLNTASSSLLQYISGIGPSIAQNIIDYRSKNGSFKERGDLLKVASFSTKIFEQAAGFLRISNGVIPLDRTGVHPERYSVVQEMAKDLNLNVPKLMELKGAPLKEKSEKWSALIGKYTFLDILNELAKPGRDPRQKFKAFQFREDLHEIKDLKKDMICPGVVTNVTHFGAFVDLGVHQDGLVHISQLSHEFVSDPQLVVQSGDLIKVKILEINIDKKQISLSALLQDKPVVGRAGGASAKSARKQGTKPGDKKNLSKNKDKRGKDFHHKRKPQTPFNNPFAALKK